MSARTVGSARFGMGGRYSPDVNARLPDTTPDRGCTPATCSGSRSSTNSSRRLPRPCPCMSGATTTVPTQRCEVAPRGSFTRTAATRRRESSRNPRVDSSPAPKPRAFYGSKRPRPPGPPRLINRSMFWARSSRPPTQNTPALHLESCFR